MAVVRLSGMGDLQNAPFGQGANPSAPPAVMLPRVSASAGFSSASTIGVKRSPVAAAVLAAKPAAPAPAAHPAVHTKAPVNARCGPEPARKQVGMVSPFVDPAAGKAWLDCMDRVQNARAEAAASYVPTAPPAAPAPVPATVPVPMVASATPGATSAASYYAAPSTSDDAAPSASPGGASSPNVQAGAPPPGQSTPATTGLLLATGAVALAAGVGLFFALR